MVRLSKFRQKMPMLALVVLYLYLGFHAFSGSQGLISWAEQSAKAERLEVKLAVLEARRDALQANVDLLSSASLDLDTLDIEARRIGFVAKSGETTIWLDPTD